MNVKIQSLTSLDVFLLALIDSGVATSYGMREQAGVSVGASRPAMRRLKKLGLVEHGKAEARNKLAFRLTQRGRRAIVAGLEYLLDEFRATPPSDTESILRIASLAASKGKKLAAVRLLKDAAGDFSRRAKEIGDKGTETESVVAGMYQAMLASCYGVHFQTLSTVLTDLAVDLTKFPTKSRTVKPKNTKTKNKM